MKKMLVCLLAVVMLAGCGATTAGGSQILLPSGYLLTSDTQVQYVEFTAAPQGGVLATWHDAQLIESPNVFSSGETAEVDASTSSCTAGTVLSPMHLSCVTWEADVTVGDGSITLQWFDRSGNVQSATLYQATRQDYQDALDTLQSEAHLTSTGG